MKLEEFQNRVETEDGADVTHVGGKTIRVHGSTTVVVDHEQIEETIYFIKYLRPLLMRSVVKHPTLLLPGLQTSTFKGITSLLEEDAMTLRKMASGNGSRQFHVSLSFHMAEQNLLSPEEVRLLAFYRRHSLGVAEKRYEKRCRQMLDGNNHRKYLGTAKQLLARAGPSGVSASKGR